MKRCCPKTCNIEAFTETDCNAFSGKGTCKYPNDAQCPEIGSFRNINDCCLFLVLK